MTSLPKPKLILFDVGGVCVLSPFQAILEYELNLDIPRGWINTAISKSAPNGYWHRLERGEIPLDNAFFHGFSADLHNAAHWSAFCQRQNAQASTALTLAPDSPPPQIDAQKLFNAIVEHSATPDPWMYPALQALRTSGQFLIGALSNTVKFPAAHALSKSNVGANAVRSWFDFFVSSAHVGMRKPEPEIYRLALERANEVLEQKRATGKGEGLAAGPIEPSDILFLDDIGENLRAARAQGFRTLKVSLGRTYEAVDELERITGLKLAGSHPPQLRAQAKI
ncbi:hypothetical protein CFIMG_005868RA [Ceratocystis fimbriata CBS 114723]|uniref:Acyl-CoA dehydrogenase family member 10 n=1 Tax=Ceratocystis fimbriata CBS 114723 TaxID=1035309 RepID=A0A2C5WVK2_9PEZI|nr:hypothetical protein CFIMG_005868RA [Ceratocystis fimbriata CBS 114723]